jgi:hypothetical protein
MRGFSAPVISEVAGQTIDDLAFLMKVRTQAIHASVRVWLTHG